MNIRVFWVSIGVVLGFLLLGGAVSTAAATEPERSLALVKTCPGDSNYIGVEGGSGINVEGTGGPPNNGVAGELQIYQDGSLVFDGTGGLPVRADGSFELPVAMDAPATFVVTIYFENPDETFRESLFVDCSKPASKRECKSGGWRAFGFKNQGQCVASVQREHV